jgi:Protein of unknown function (DUF3631)
MKGKAMYNIANANQDFLAALRTRQLGLGRSEKLVANGTWQRCTALNKSDDNDDGSYLAIFDELVPWGFYRNWTDGEDKTSYWRGKATRAYTTAELEELERHIKQARLEAEEEAAREREKAAVNAQQLWHMTKLDAVLYSRLLTMLKSKIRTSDLSRRVKAEAEVEVATEAPPDSRLYEHWDVEPWPEPVTTEPLLKELTGQITRYVATLEQRACVPALWIMSTYVHDIMTHSPNLLVTSPEPDCGKTTLLGVAGFTAWRSLSSVEISGPALFRSLTKWTPAFIIDEADQAFAHNTDLRSVFNSGWTRGQGVVRCDPDTHEPRLYSTFAPKALGMKGVRMPDTTLSRAIIVELKRKQPNEIVEDFDHQDNDAFALLRRKLLRWAADHTEQLRKAVPTMPAGFYNRTRMNWWMLFAIAELAGEKAAMQARTAAQTIENTKDKNYVSLGTTLLSDLREIFGKSNVLFSRDIIRALVEDPEKPWATYRRGKPLTERQLAYLLKEYGVKPNTVQDEFGRAKGYERKQFIEVWERYLPKITRADTDRTVERTDQFKRYTDLKRANPLKNNNIHGCTDRVTP